MQNYEEGELSILRSEIYKVTVLLEEQAKTLEKEKQQLADSMSDISHQLKTPLTSMLMMTDLLCEQPMDAATGKTFLLQIREQLERMQWLVSSLLKLAKLDAGAVTLKREPLTVFPLIHKAVAPLLVMMEDKGLSLEILGQDDAWIVADDHWTIEALTNIIKNCIEHTKVGGLKIRAVQTNLYTRFRLRIQGRASRRPIFPIFLSAFIRGKMRMKIA
ncbi:MAG: sensor histidine kinase [Clostridia bacterium]